MSPKEAGSRYVSWTLFVRLTHWLVAASVLINFFNDTGFWHRTIGYIGLALVILRIVYGLFLSKVITSKLSIPNFSSIKVHCKELLSGQVPTHVGHNPLGQYAVYLMWLLIGFLAFTGWLSRTDAYWGEDWPVDLHMMLSSILEGLVILHVLATLVMSKLQKQNLVKKMIRSCES